MYEETVVSSRPDRELRKKIITPGDYDIVPYEDSRCKLKLSDITCTNDAGKCEIESESVIFNKDFNGIILIGDMDSFIDKDLELILQQMCSGETCAATLVYRDNDGKLVKEIKCTIELQEVMEEQVISDWSWQRLHEAAMHHKERGVELVKEKRLTDAFRRFNKAFKMVVAMEPIDREVVDEERVKEVIDLRVKLYNNLAHIQLQFNEYEAAHELCNRALEYDPENVKALYRRCLAGIGMEVFENAYTDIKHVLRLTPNDKAAQEKARYLQPIVDRIHNQYKNFVKRMFM